MEQQPKPTTTTIPASSDRSPTYFLVGILMGLLIVLTLTTVEPHLEDISENNNKDLEGLPPQFLSSKTENKNVPEKKEQNSAFKENNNNVNKNNNHVLKDGQSLHHHLHELNDGNHIHRPKNQDPSVYENEYLPPHLHWLPKEKPPSSIANVGRSFPDAFPPSLVGEKDEKLKKEHINQLNAANEDIKGKLQNGLVSSKSRYKLRPHVIQFLKEYQMKHPYLDLGLPKPTLKPTPRPPPPPARKHGNNSQEAHDAIRVDSHFDSVLRKKQQDDIMRRSQKEIQDHIVKSRVSLKNQQDDATVRVIEEQQERERKEEERKESFKKEKERVQKLHDNDHHEHDNTNADDDDDEEMFGAALARAQKRSKNKHH